MIGCDICFKRALWEIIPFTSSDLYKKRYPIHSRNINKFFHLQVVKLHLFEVFLHKELTAVIKRCINRETLKESLANGRMHGAPYRGYGYVPLRFEGGGTSLGEWENNNNESLAIVIVLPRRQQIITLNK